MEHVDRTGRRYKFIAKNLPLNICEFGSIFELIEDDGTNFPWCKLLEGELFIFDPARVAICLDWVEEIPND